VGLQIGAAPWRPGECMKVTWTELEVPGLLLSSGASVQDQRGSFTKVLSGADSVLGNFEGKELYWTSSARGVLRGLHFQLPPAATRKLVYVVNGAIRDFIVDLRVGSPMERRVFEIELSPSVGGLLVPVGCAHAYEALEDNTIVCYAQDIPFSDEDSYGGIRAESAGIIPRADQPIVMPRDLEFPALEEFGSPFVFD
jgi:dTDP-4-dehydrorhamnose 3,5-epimerase and related enzymes